MDFNQDDLDGYEQIRNRENAKRGIETYNLSKEIRPCIGQALVTQTGEGVGIGRSKTGKGVNNLMWHRGR